LNDLGQTVFPGVGPVVGRTRTEAEEKFRVIQSLLSLDEAMAYLGRFFDHHDFTQYEPDASFPDLGEIGPNSFRSTTDRIKAEAAEKGLTLREVAFATATPRPSFIGTGTEVAEEIIRWIDAGASDGFILGFPVQAEGLEDFVTLVIPELEARGRYSRELPGETLRDHLGLPRKPSRYSQRDPAVHAGGHGGGLLPPWLSQRCQSHK
jgi:alkanesulfonate monooxygenase SsuD/methylene tetrahydromethanopterin reductase-like flavin-dependent oxidoreductase (luciferase family)